MYAFVHEDPSMFPPQSTGVRQAPCFSRDYILNLEYDRITPILLMPLNLVHKYTNVFTTEARRTQRGIYFDLFSGKSFCLSVSPDKQKFFSVPSVSLW
jgi:hypothetical protein